MFKKIIIYSALLGIMGCGSKSETPKVEVDMNLPETLTQIEDLSFQSSIFALNDNETRQLVQGPDNGEIDPFTVSLSTQASKLKRGSHFLFLQGGILYNEEPLILTEASIPFEYDETKLIRLTTNTQTFETNQLDDDGDSVSNLQEFLNGTDPFTFEEFISESASLGNNPAIASTSPIQESVEEILDEGEILEELSEDKLDANFAPCPNGIDNGVDACNCSRAVFVAASGDDTFSGTKEYPLQTISKGIELAALNDRDVYISEGEYREDVFLKKAVNLYGGFKDTECERDIHRYNTKIISENTKGFRVVGPLDKNIRLDGLIFLGRHPRDATGLSIERVENILLKDNIMDSGAASHSSYGLQINDSNVDVSSNIIISRLSPTPEPITTQSAIRVSGVVDESMTFDANQLYCKKGSSPCPFYSDINVILSDEEDLDLLSGLLGNFLLSDSELENRIPYEL